jgi:chromosome segregation ATPase
VIGWHRYCAFGLLCSGLLASAAAQSIYSCTDARGNKLTSDRPIAECLDREQKELNPSGSVRRSVAPSLTAVERERIEAQQRKEAEEKARVNEERRRNRALLMRYQDQAAHDRERADALKQVDEVIVAANKRLAELDKQNDAIKAELEFYKNDATKAPAKLRRQIAEHEESVRAQQRFIADQAVEKKRVNDRFDEELARLKPLWNGAK